MHALTTGCDSLRGPVVALDVEQVSREYFDRIHRAALVLTGSPWDADDLAQETFLVLAKQSDRFQGKSSVYTWLYGILLNLERSERRRRATRNRKLHVLGEAASSQTAQPPADAAAEVAEWKKSLWSRVAELPDGQRQSLVLRFSEGLPYDQIAQVLECPLGTVKSRIFHGLAALRRMMNESTDQPPEFPNEDQNRAIPS